MLQGPYDFEIVTQLKRIADSLEILAQNSQETTELELEDKSLEDIKRWIDACYTGMSGRD